MISKISEKINLGRLAEMFSLSLLGFHSIGFFVWNFYLNVLGFSKFDLFQGKYILTGILVLIILMPILLFSIYLYKIIRINKYVFLILSLLIHLIIFISFIYFIFPKIPPQWGGGEPIMIAIVSDTETIEFWKEFGLGGMYTKQTATICVLYENNDSIIILLKDRIIEMDKSPFLGKVSTPSYEAEQIKNNCSKVIQNYLFPSKNHLNFEV